MCKHNNYHKILSFREYKKKSVNSSHNNFIMPYSLKQLEERRDACIKNLQEYKEYKESAKEKGGLDLGVLTFNSGAFFFFLG